MTKRLEMRETIILELVQFLVQTNSTIFLYSQKTLQTKNCSYKNRWTTACSRMWINIKVHLTNLLRQMHVSIFTTSMSPNLNIWKKKGDGQVSTGDELLFLSHSYLRKPQDAVAASGKRCLSKDDFYRMRQHFGFRTNHHDLRVMFAKACECLRSTDSTSGYIKRLYMCSNVYVAHCEWTSR